jgi:hypothetical protein
MSGAAAGERKEDGSGMAIGRARAGAHPAAPACAPLFACDGWARAAESARAEGV